MANDKDESTNKETPIHFYGEDAKWREFAAKAKALGQKKGWWSATQKDLSNDNSETAKTANSAARHWLMMACKDEAFKYIMMHEEDAFRAWNALKTR